LILHQFINKSDKTPAKSLLFDELIEDIEERNLEKKDPAGKPGQKGFLRIFHLRLGKIFDFSFALDAFGIFKF
jgi:hypothetical protein